MSAAEETERIQSLRRELKDWEYAFAAKHDGRKPSKNDIKKDVDIAHKYKLYSRLRSQDEKKKARGIDDRQGVKTPRKGSQSIVGGAKYIVVNTPTKSEEIQKSFATPGSGSAHDTAAHLRPIHLDVYDSPSVLRQLFSPGLRKNTQQDSPFPLRSALGPTPQRNGKALGLFDLMSSSSKSVTPSKRKTADLSVDDETNVRTPTRKSTASSPQATADDNGGTSTPRRHRAHSNSPVSASRQFYLTNFFATPTTRRLMASISQDDEVLGDLGMSPLASIRTRGPLFAEKRSSSSTDEDNDLKKTPEKSSRFTGVKHRATNAHASPKKACTPPTRKLAGNGLTRIVEELKALEEECFNDDLEAEMEARTRSGSKSADGHTPAEPGEERQRIWKKKGQKRTTRRVNMKPSRAKPKTMIEPHVTEQEDATHDRTGHREFAPDIYEDETARPRKFADPGIEGRGKEDEATVPTQTEDSDSETQK
ncbi:DNA replication regulator sld2, partial [Ascosphaera aggregata]